MNKPRPPRTAPDVQARPEAAGAPVRTAVRTAQRPVPAPAPREDSWLARAWARHPLVAMSRHRPRLTFFQGLHSMIRAGLALPVAFSDLSRGAAKDPFRRAVAQVGEAVAGGAGLAEAMRRLPVWFDAQTVELLGAAEATGTLEAALARICQQLEEAQRMRWRAVMLCLYPGYLLAAFLVGGTLLDTASTLMSSGAQPESIGTLILSLFLQKVLLVASLGMGAFVAPLLLAAPAIEPHWAAFRMHVPLLGRVHRQLQASRFSLVLGVGLGAGLEAGRSLQMALESTGSGVLRKRAGLAVHRLRSGAGLTDVVEWLEVLDGESLQRVSIGERTGELEPTLAQLAQEHSEAAMRSLRALMFVVVTLLAVFLFATNIGKLVQLQGGYQQRLDSLGSELSH